MSDLDDEVKETKATRFQKILDKLALIEKAVNKPNEEKPKQIKKKKQWIKIVIFIRIKGVYMLRNSTTKILSFLRRRH